MKRGIGDPVSGNGHRTRRSGSKGAPGSAGGRATGNRTPGPSPSQGIHPAWREFVRYCTELGHGEIEQLKIQDGLPVLAEVTRKKVRFS